LELAEAELSFITVDHAAQIETRSLLSTLLSLGKVRGAPLVVPASLDGAREATSPSSGSFTSARFIHPIMKKRRLQARNLSPKPTEPTLEDAVSVFISRHPLAA
jgi:hypothetical protein